MSESIETSIKLKEEQHYTRISNFLKNLVCRKCSAPQMEIQLCKRTPKSHCKVALCTYSICQNCLKNKEETRINFCPVCVNYHDFGMNASHFSNHSDKCFPKYFDKMEQKYKCPICSKGFSTDSFLQHVVLHLKRWIASSSGPKTNHLSSLTETVNSATSQYVSQHYPVANTTNSNIIANSESFDLVSSSRNRPIESDDDDNTFTPGTFGIPEEIEQQQNQEEEDLIIPNTERSDVLSALPGDFDVDEIDELGTNISKIRQKEQLLNNLIKPDQSSEEMWKKRVDNYKDVIKSTEILKPSDSELIYPQTPKQPISYKDVVDNDFEFEFIFKDYLIPGVSTSVAGTFLESLRGTFLEGDISKCLFSFQLFHRRFPFIKIFIQIKFCKLLNQCVV